MTPNEFRLKVLCHASTSYSQAEPTAPTARQVERASQLADECLREAMRLNLFGAADVMPAPVAQSAVAQPETTQPIMPPPLQGFVAQPAATSEVAPTAPLAPQAAA